MVIVLIIAAIIVLPFVLALLVKKGYSLEKEVLIKRPSKEVFEYLRRLKNQDNFNKWTQTDPAMKKEYRGEDGTVGFIYAWNGNKKAGEGEQEIKGINEGKRIDIEVRFVRPFQSVAQTPFIVETVSEDETKVRWGISSTMKYPMNAMLLFLNMDKLLGKDMEHSLLNLKNQLEKN